MEDLYVFFRKRLACGRTSLHPHRWLSSEFGSIAPSVLDCQFGRRSLFELVEHLPLAIIDGVEITSAKLGLRALRRLGRQSAPGKYLAHASLAFQYWTHEPMVVQHALHDFLAETICSLRLEVPCPTGKADCVTPRAVIEVAPVAAWKAAMGHLCAYALHFADRRRILWLFGEDSLSSKLDVIRETCSRYHIVVAYTRCSSSAFGPVGRQRPLPPGLEEGKLASERASSRIDLQGHTFPHPVDLDALEAKDARRES